mgnify:FL=1
MLKRLVSAVVGVTCIAATVGVSAATPNVSTSTVYNGTGTIKVVSTVSGASSGNIYTYLAYDKNVTTVTQGSEIVYIDQKTADGVTVAFEYVTKNDNVGSKVKVGGKSADGTAFEANDTNTIPALATAVNVKVNNGDATRVEVDLSDTTAYVQLSFTDTNPVSSVTVSGKESVDWFAGSGCVWILAGDLTNGATVTITTAEAAVAVAYDTLAGGYLANDGGVKSLIVAGKVTGNDATTDYGIEIATTSEFTGSTKYKALGKGSDGTFAIKLQDLANGNLTGDTVYARAYYGENHADKYVMLSINGAVDAPGTLLK